LTVDQEVGDSNSPGGTSLIKDQPKSLKSILSKLGPVRPDRRA
jgi:hypothetical protein